MALGGAAVSILGGAAASAAAARLTSEPGLPDLIVTAVEWTVDEGANWNNDPVPEGSDVWFRATIQNVGTGVTPGGVIHGISFRTNGVARSWSDDNTTSLGVGQSRTQAANGGPVADGSNKYWDNAPAGTYTLTVLVDDINRMAESNETNNSLSTEITVTSATVRLQELPFDIPSKATLDASSKLVVAHWHNWEIYEDQNNSIYNNTHLNPNGAGGQYFGAGGFMSQKPVPIFGTPAQSTWLKDSYRKDIEWAHDIGLNAFFRNSWTDLPNDSRLIACFDACDEYNQDNDPDFYIAICLDCAIIGEGNNTPNLWADRVAPFMDRQSYFQWNGAYIVGTFEAFTNPDWFVDFVARMASVHGKTVKFIPSLNKSNTGQLDPYSALVPGVWPAVNPWLRYAPTVNPSTLFDFMRDWVQARGGEFMGTLRVAQQRRNNFTVLESRGIDCVRIGWQGSIENDDPMFMIQTWNDFAEGHPVRPGTGYQYAFYDLCAYYNTWFKTGVQPTIVRDVLYYCHRMHRTDVAFSSSQTQPFSFISGVAGLNNVYAAAFLTAPNTVTLIINGVENNHSVPAGVTQVSSPLVAGSYTPAFRVGSAIPQFSSAFTTRTGTQQWQDLHYRMGGSSRPAVAEVQNDLPGDRLA